MLGGNMSKVHCISVIAGIFLLLAINAYARGGRSMCNIAQKLSYHERVPASFSLHENPLDDFHAAPLANEVFVSEKIFHPLQQIYPFVHTYKLPHHRLLKYSFVVKRHSMRIKFVIV
jgi:hypothetical protein